MTFTKAQKIFVGISIILVVIGISVGGCQKQPEKYTGPVEKITFGVETSILPSAVWVAENKGYFQEEGLDVEIKEFGSGRTALATMLNEGNLDMVTVAQTPVMFNSFERNDYRCIGHRRLEYCRKPIRNTGSARLSLFVSCYNCGKPADIPRS